MTQVLVSGVRCSMFDVRRSVFACSIGLIQLAILGLDLDP